VTTAVTLAVVLALALDLRPDAAAQPAPAEPCAAPAPRPDGLLLAGSGSNVAVVRAIASWFRAPNAPAVRVPESIGTGGALRALSDGAVDVGLASRPLTAAEKQAGFVETVLGQVPVAVVVHPRLSVRDVSRGDLVAIYRGERDRWPDGTPIVPLLRERGDSGNDLVARAWPDVWAAMDAALGDGRFTTCYTDQELADTVAGTDGAIGLLDVGTLRLTHPALQPIAVDGVPPTPLRAESGSHPLVKTLTFVTLGPPSGDAARFVAFATSPETTELLAGYGYFRPTSR
jgi:phosphate transport system substrate-binding protein